MTPDPKAPQARTSLRKIGLTAVLLAGTALGGYAAGHASFAAVDAQGTTPNAAQSTQTTSVNPPGTQLAPHALPDFSALVSQVKPAVVSITTKLKPTAA
ncbi:MAG: hypothetical protein J0H99_13505, partial [Rhodospirillales bacterium]|nr:hypothetical protein [Rhodospirillales bacterium]